MSKNRLWKVGAKTQEQFYVTGLIGSTERTAFIPEKPPNSQESSVKEALDYFRRLLITVFRATDVPVPTRCTGSKLPYLRKWEPKTKEQFYVTGLIFKTAAQSALSIRHLPNKPPNSQEFISERSTHYFRRLFITVFRATDVPGPTLKVHLLISRNAGISMQSRKKSQPRESSHQPYAHLAQETAWRGVRAVSFCSSGGLRGTLRPPDDDSAKEKAL
ncbi:hypothetical protein B0H19DRAFT_1071710 [Mycena capillaripes]|nr:hypothetical protein B0H19DRAFT_1071710 [Mycena capillaripes]